MLYEFLSSTVPTTYPTNLSWCHNEVYRLWISACNSLHLIVSASEWLIITLREKVDPGLLQSWCQSGSVFTAASSSYADDRALCLQCLPLDCAVIPAGEVFAQATDTSVFWRTNTSDTTRNDTTRQDQHMAVRVCLAVLKLVCFTRERSSAVFLTDVCNASHSTSEGSCLS
jgi:hypothetical protein